LFRNITCKSQKKSLTDTKFAYSGETEKGMSSQLVINSSGSFPWLVWVTYVAVTLSAAHYNSSGHYNSSMNILSR